MSDYHESIVLTDLSLNLDWNKNWEEEKPSVTQEGSKQPKKLKTPKLPSNDCECAEYQMIINQQMRSLENLTVPCFNLISRQPF
jgi:hypothetical protein